MQIVRVSVKVAAVLGIAALVVLLVAATLLYALQKTLTGDVQDVSRHAAGESPSNSVDFNAAARHEGTTRTASEIAEPTTSNAVSESSVAAPEASFSQSEPVVSTANAPAQSPSEIERGERSQADNKPPLAAGSRLPPTQESTAAASSSSEAAPESSESTQPASATPGIRYYTVESGDTLYKIARRFYGAGKYWEAVYNANRSLINDARELKLGWKLELPPRESVVKEN
jgi:nucleoid-associated protein YgaU